MGHQYSIRRLLPLLALALLLALRALPAEAQGVGIFSRPACTTITSAVIGQTFCFDQTANTLKRWTGTSWLPLPVDDYSNLRDFGGVDDNSTDNSVALTNCLLSAKPCFVPPTLSSFNFASTITFPRNAQLLGVGPVAYQGSVTIGTSTLKYTGASDAFVANDLGLLIRHSGVVRGIALVGNASAQNGFRLYNLIQFSFIDNAFTGFVIDPYAPIATSGNAVDDILVDHNIFNNNVSCIALATSGAGNVNSNWTVTRNFCAGTAATNHLWYLNKDIQNWEIAGNDTSFAGGSHADWYFGGIVNGLAFHGNWVNPNRIDTVPMQFAGTGGTVPQNGGIAITGNFFYQSFAGATGSAITFAGNCDGCIIRGNFVYNFATQAGNIAINPAGFVFTNSDVGNNSITGANISYGTFGAGSTNTVQIPVSISTGSTGTPLTIVPGGNGLGMRIGTGASNNSAQLAFLGSSTARNFLVANQQNIANALEITPSTANGGATFNTPAVLVYGTGGVTIGTPTGTDKGLGTLNTAVGYYANNNQFINASGTLINTSFTFAQLNLVLTANGMMVYCSDCTFASALDQTCVGGGSGNLAVRVNGVFKCAY